tara:strand:- start:739 stop:1275 length:537 start_codon:yes stop_codon:yes gene_type:complete
MKEINLSSGGSLSRRGLQRLDLLLLAIESLDLNGSQAMIWNSEKIGIQNQIPNHVELWKSRSHNPIRKVTRRGRLKASQTDALIKLVCSMAERIYPIIRQLLSSKEPEQLTKDRWNSFLDRITDLISERMNTRRQSVRILLNPDLSHDYYRQLVFSLALSAGSGGFDRLKASLLDSRN